MGADSLPLSILLSLLFSGLENQASFLPQHRSVTAISHQISSVLSPGHSLTYLQVLSAKPLPFFLQSLLCSLSPPLSMVWFAHLISAPGLRPERWPGSGGPECRSASLGSAWRRALGQSQGTQHPACLQMNPSVSAVSDASSRADNSHLLRKAPE